MSQGVRRDGLRQVVREQSAALEERPEPRELLGVAKLLQLEMLESLLRLIAVVEAEGDEVGHDAPRASVVKESVASRRWSARAAWWAEPAGGSLDG